MLKLMYITNRPEVACIAEAAGVDRIFVDMEYLYKAQRQGGMDTVQSRHTVSDIRAIRRSVSKAKLLVRCNPLHPASAGIEASKQEIDRIIDAGADIIMLPFFKTAEEVAHFLRLVDGRARTMPLVETPEAAGAIDQILELDGIDEIFIGLNDLSLGLHKKFMFELLSDGTVEQLCIKFRQKGIPFGFGGIAALGEGALPAERVIREHYRLGSSAVILSRSFCDISKMSGLKQVEERFFSGVGDIRALEQECAVHSRYFFDNLREMQQSVRSICTEMS